MIFQHNCLKGSVYKNQMFNENAFFSLQRVVVFNLFSCFSLSPFFLLHYCNVGDLEKKKSENQMIFLLITENAWIKLAAVICTSEVQTQLRWCGSPACKHRNSLLWLLITLKKVTLILVVLWRWLLVCVLRTNYSKLCLLPGIVGMTPVHFVMCPTVSSLSQFLRHQLWPWNGSADTTKMGSFLANHQVLGWFVLFKNRFQGQQKKKKN